MWLRAVVFGVLAAQLGACASLESGLTGDGALRGGIGTLAVAQAEPRVISQDGEDAGGAEDLEPVRVAAVGAGPQSGPAIQGQPIFSAPAPAGHYGHHGEPALVPEGDPLEHINRHVFHFNEALDTHLVEPTARAYRSVLPREVRQSVRNVFSNLESPVTFTNDVLQGEWERAHITLTRFAINTTIGVAGLHDRAAEMGYEVHHEDFDQTLAVYGVPSGPYLMLPLLGPATPRHVAGRVVDAFTHPLTWMLAGEPTATRVIPRAVELIAARSDLLDTIEQVRATSTDYYVTVRNTYRQNRNSEITNGLGAGGDGDFGIILEDELDLDY